MKRNGLFKRISTACLAFILLIGILPVSALAGDGYEELGNNGALWARARDAADLSDGFLGSGTAEDPYLLEDADDLNTLDELVTAGETFEGKHFKVTADITLSSGWDGIGKAVMAYGKPTTENYDVWYATSMNPFSGTLDGGGHTLTFSGKPLFDCVHNATIKNLKISGSINDDGLIANYVLDTGDDSEADSSDWTANISSVTILSGTTISGSGFLNGYASRMNAVTISNCHIQSGVSIGTAGTSNVGGFAGDFNGSISNSTCAGTVYGKDFIGGIIGGQGQSLSTTAILNCSFSGTVMATGNYVGGISGAGYTGTGWGLDSAPNADCIDIQNCTVTGSITGGDYVGGILGAEPGVMQCWENAQGTITGNRFSGTLIASGSKVGGIIGYMESLNKYNYIFNNTYSGVARGIGDVKYLDTSYANPAKLSSTEVFTSTEDTGISGISKTNHYRTDNPLGTDANNLASSGTMQELVVTGYKTTYFRGDTFTLDGANITVKWSNNHESSVKPELVTHSGFDSSQAVANQQVTLSYQGLTAVIAISITDDTVTSLTISDNYETEYWVGDTLDLSDATITVSWEHGPDTTLTQNELTFSGDCTSAGVLNTAGTNLTITATYGGKSDTLTVTVKQPTVTGLTIELSDNFKTSYVVGESFSLSGATITASWSNGEKTTLQASDVTVSGFNGSKAGSYTVKIAYNGKETIIPNTITVEAASVSNSITVTFTLLGDSAHGESGITHTLKAGNLTTWISATSYTIPKGSTVKYLLVKALDNHDMSCDNPAGNYVKSITRNGVTLAEFTNGKNSGWMYTLNGTHPDLSLADQTLNNGDKVVWHYTDDHTKEDGSTGNSTSGTGNGTGTGTGTGTITAATANDVIKLIDAIGDAITAESKEKIDAARSAYDKLSDADKKNVTNYDKLLEAERKLAEILDLSPAQYVTYRFPSVGEYLVNTVTQPVIGSIGGDWIILGLSRAEYPVPDGYYTSYYASVEQAAAESNGVLHEKKYTDQSRIILSLTAIGKDPRNVAGFDLLAPLADFEQVCWQGINGPIWALMALDSANYPAPEAIPGKTRTTRSGLIQHILDNEVDGGGWSLSDTADVDLTAMAIQALAPYYETNSEVKNAIERGLTLLSTKQSDRGGFSNGSEMNAESCAQVIVALTALGIDPSLDQRFIKNGNSVLDALDDFAAENGGYKHVLDGEVNGMATEQAYYALVAYERLLDKKTALYDMTDIHNYGGDPEESEPIDVPEEPEENQDPEKRSFPWWAVILIGVCGAAGITLFIFRKKLFDESLD